MEIIYIYMYISLDIYRQIDIINTNEYVIGDWKSAKERYRIVVEQVCMWCGEGSLDEVTFKLRIQG